VSLIVIVWSKQALTWVNKNWSLSYASRLDFQVANLVYHHKLSGSVYAGRKDYYELARHVQILVRNPFSSLPLFWA
jgi:hypothetical protein